MARVTVEDCIDKVGSRFELVLIAAKRARQLARGAALTIDRDNDKNSVVSLREIAEGSIDLEELREEMIKHHQKHVIFDDDEEDEEVIELMAGEQGWSGSDDSSSDELLDTMQAEEIELTDEDEDLPSEGDINDSNEA